jgi:Tol biopolymer transport system component
MALASGSKLGPYEIQSPLGAGGMGEVYRARDTRLDRDVAIKVLPADLASDAVLRQRLEREARAVSRLSHPHICTLHDVGQQEGVFYLVMELVEGETLERRLLKGPLPADQTLRYGSQIADALARAHRLGFTHRDLKPSNIMLTRAGAKLMDFGLAKQSVSDPLGHARTENTVDRSRLTSDGMLVGTFQYMAPEQLEGKEADARTDIFALGEVLYEMVTGRPAFTGSSRASLIASILTAEPPPITQLQPVAPLALERVVRKCLAKDPDDRWQSASDLGSELHWIAESGSQAAPLPGARASAPSPRRWLAWALAAGLLAAVAALAGRQFLAPKPSTPAAHVNVSLPAEVSLADRNWHLLALSQDGTELVFTGGKHGSSQLYLRRFDQWDAAPIAGTEGAENPFFSPDGQWVAFTSDGKLKKLPLAGGPAVDLATTGWGGGDWGPDGQIVYSSTYNGGLLLVPANGGPARQWTAPDHSRGELAHWWPQFLPDGDHIVYTAYSSPIERSRIVVRSLKSGSEKTLVEGGVFARYLPPRYLIFARGETVLAAPFDAGKLQLTGPAVPVLDGVGSFSQNGLSQLAVSANGTLAYLSRSFISSPQKLVAVDRHGQVRAIHANLRLHGGMRLSPDGKKLAMGLEGEGGSPPDVWIQDLVRGSLSRITHGPGTNFNAIWTLDGRQIIYESERPAFDIYRRSADGAGVEEMLLSSGNDKCPLSISPDGKTLLFCVSTDTSLLDLWIAPLTDLKNGKPFVSTPSTETGGMISPDGRWVAYQSDESGQTEIYVIGFPSGQNRVQVSADGGIEPLWSRDGKELFFRSGNKLISLPVQNSADFSTGPARVLFEGQFATSSQPGIPPYEISPDGQTFYFVQDDAPEHQHVEVNVIFNWAEELNKAVHAAN